MVDGSGMRMKLLISSLTERSGGWRLKAGVGTFVSQTCILRPAGTTINIFTRV